MLKTLVPMDVTQVGPARFADVLVDVQVPGTTVTATPSTTAAVVTLPATVTSPTMATANTVV